MNLKKIFMSKSLTLTIRRILKIQLECVMIQLRLQIWSYTHGNGASLLRMASENIGGTEKLSVFLTLVSCH